MSELKNIQSDEEIKNANVTRYNWDASLGRGRIW